MRNARTGLLALLFIPGPCIPACDAQGPDSEQQHYLETLVESVSEELDDTPDMTGLLDDLAEFITNPLNLNSANADELGRLRFLNDYQIAAVIDYRNRNGVFQSVYELQYLPGFREQDIDRLLVFTNCTGVSNKPVSIKKSLKYANHVLLIRYQRVPEKQAGYRDIPDSVLLEDHGRARMMGSPDKLYLRYGFQSYKYFRAGFLAEKDAGEEIFRGSNPSGFDLYSAYLGFKDEKRIVREILLGDYQLQTGQGLLLWTSYAMGKSAGSNDLLKRPSGIKGNTSADENRYLRGVAVRLGYRKVNLTLFTSKRFLDATLSDSLNTIITIRETGYHTTPAEIASEKNVSQFTTGANIRYSSLHLHTSLSAYNTQFSNAFEKSDKLYRNYAPVGSQFSGIAADYRYLAGRFQIFGELANASGGWASLNGLLYFLQPGISIGLIYRNYSKKYYSFYSSAFAENSIVNNEQGFYLNADINFGTYYLRTYTDIYTFPWLKYQVNAPTSGNELFIELGRDDTGVNAYLRLSRREKYANLSGGESLKEIGQNITHSLRANLKWHIYQRFTLQNRLEFKVNQVSEADRVYGWALMQDINYKPLVSGINISGRFAWFNAPEYAARIYAYERDVLYAYTSQMHYGKGYRVMLLLEWKPMDKLTFYLRYARTDYPGQSSTGSGLSMIRAGHKSEIKLQLVLKL
jgi:DNA uptake protein ComE-like DNA-binding protein